MVTSKPLPCQFQQDEELINKSDANQGIRNGSVAIQESCCDEGGPRSG